MRYFLKNHLIYNLIYYFIIPFLLLAVFHPGLIAEQNSFGAYGAIEWKQTKIAGNNGSIIGVKFGWVICKNFVIGGAYNAVVNNVQTKEFDPISLSKPYLDFNYGGLYFEYVILPDRFIHSTVGITLAGGGLNFIPINDSAPHSDYSVANLLIFEPEINLEANLLKWFHLAVGASYRQIASSSDYYSVSFKELRGTSVKITFKFGSY